MTPYRISGLPRAQEVMSQGMVRCAGSQFARCARCRLAASRLQALSPFGLAAVMQRDELA
jgi:hypothetical protein